MEKFSNAIFFRQMALQNLQRKNLEFPETELVFDKFDCIVIVSSLDMKYKKLNGRYR